MGKIKKFGSTNALIAGLCLGELLWALLVSLQTVRHKNNFFETKETLKLFFWFKIYVFVIFVWVGKVILSQNQNLSRKKDMKTSKLNRKAAISPIVNKPTVKNKTFHSLGDFENSYFISYHQILFYSVFISVFGV